MPGCAATPWLQLAGNRLCCAWLSTGTPRCLGVKEGRPTTEGLDSTEVKPTIKGLGRAKRAGEQVRDAPASPQTRRGRTQPRCGRAHTPAPGGGGQWIEGRGIWNVRGARSTASRVHSRYSRRGQALEWRNSGSNVKVVNYKRCSHLPACRLTIMELGRLSKSACCAWNSTLESWGAGSSMGGGRAGRSAAARGTRSRPLVSQSRTV